MAMDSLRAAKKVSEFYLKLRDCSCYNGGQDVLRYLEKVMDEEFQNATRSMDNIDITTPKGTLYFGIRTFEDSVNMPYIIGHEVARYWSTTIVPDATPQKCKKIDSVTNDAWKIENPIAEDLINMAKANLVREPYYQEFFKIIFDRVRTIRWTVVEKDDKGCKATFTVQVT